MTRRPQGSRCRRLHVVEGMCQGIGYCDRRPFRIHATECVVHPAQAQQHTRGIILVTDSFHLPRSGLSFLWAGARDIQLFPAYGASQTLMPGYWTIGVEAVKVWANALRAQVYSLAGVAGVSDELRIRILH